MGRRSTALALSLTIAATGSTSLAAGGAAWAQDGMPDGREEGPVKLVLSLEKAEFAAGEPVKATLTIKNESSLDVAVHAVCAVMDAAGHRAPIRFAITAADGHDVAYIHGERGVAKKFEFKTVTLAPGKELSFPITLDAWYDLSRPGRYKIRACWVESDPNIGEGASRDAEPLRSNEVEIAIGGR